MYKCSMNLARTFRFTGLYRPSLPRAFATMPSIINGDLNNTEAERVRDEISIDPAYRFRSFAIPPSEDDPVVRKNYRPFLLDDDIESDDWVAKLELSTVLKLVEAHGLSNNGKRLRVLVLHGSMRNRLVT